MTGIEAAKALPAVAERASLSRRQPAPGAADWLRLAAAPTFATMALLTGVLGGGPLETLCSAASPLNGRVAMYVLMSVFHLSPWLKLISGQQEATTPRAKRGAGLVD